jgi:KaiC/GvpD/RAD55 family RecA-like ATPase
MKMATPQEKAQEAMKEIRALLGEAQNDTPNLFTGKIDESKLNMVINPNASLGERPNKPEEGFKTYTFLDKMFLNVIGVSLDGLPFGSNAILTGLPNSGKTLLVMEVALRVAENGKKVAYVTSEKIFRVDNARYDLESQMREMAGILNLDWLKIVDNLFVIDTVKFAELRDWTNFISTYRTLVELKKIDIVLIDSMTLLEEARGALKYRVLELMRYNQTHGLTSIMINQRAIEEADTLAMAGGIALSYAVDVVMALDYKKVSSWDAQIKQDTGAKQSEVLNFFRILKCSLSKFDAHYKAYEITQQGQVKLKDVVQT